MNQGMISLIEWQCQDKWKTAFFKIYLNNMISQKIRYLMCLYLNINDYSFNIL